MAKRIDLLNSARAFYLGEGEITLTDEEYDTLRSELGLTEQEIMEEIGISQVRVPGLDRHDISFPKSKYKMNSYLPLEEDKKYYDVMKYDGSSLTVLYKDGKLRNILSSSGISQLTKLHNHVPQKVDPSITYIKCEAVVSHEKYGDAARGKANGLINSKKMQDEVDENLKLMAFYCPEMDLDQLCRYRTDKFRIADKIGKGEIQKLPTTNVYKDFMVDGVVRYYNDPSENRIFKLYYVSSKKTKVIDIDIRDTSTKTKSVRLQVEPVTIDGATYNYVSPNGFNNLFNLGLGKGAEIEVIRSGSTIAKVLNVIKPNHDITITCGCGENLTSDHIVGNNLRCPNELCSDRLSAMRNEFDEWMESPLLDFIESDIKYHYYNMLSVERYNLKKLTIQVGDDNIIRDLLEKDDFDQLYEFTSGRMGLNTDQMKDNLKYKLIAYMAILKERLKNENS